MTALETLIALVAPPADPAGAPFDWPAIEAELGTPLPSDYKAYCDTYGHGGFVAGWSLYPLTPGGDGPFDDLLATGWRDGPYASPPRPPYPAPGGLLPFGYTELRWVFWWETIGEPERWRVLLEDDGGDLYPLPLTATGYFAQFVAGESWKGWSEPDDDEEELDPPVFYPAR